MNNPYIRSFIIGSSAFVVFPFYYIVGTIPQNQRNYSYRNYTFIAPLFLGTMNSLSLFMGNHYNLTLRQRLFIISIISSISVIAFAYLSKSCDYAKEQWIRYAFSIIIHHFFAYNITMYLLEGFV